MPEVFVNSFTHLKDRPNAEQALHTLQRSASLVKPIMHKHGWVLPVLSEFFPEDPHLLGLNINHGEKILVRLRPSHAPDTFYDEEHVVGTLLHELTHNVHGPHDDKFYKLLSTLEEEYDTLRRSGYSGEGFHSKGHRLGNNLSHNLPPHLARQKALDAAEKRRQVSIVLSGGGRLGGGPKGNKSPRELAAEAAERRARDEKACASGAVAQREAEKAAKESVQDDVIDLTADSDSDLEPEIVIVDEASPSPTLYSPASSTPTSSGLASPGSGSLSASSASSASLNTLVSSALRHGSGSATPSSSTSTLSAAERSPRPPVRRVPRGAGDGQPTLPKPRSVSRPPSRAHPKAPSTPPPTRAGSLSVSRHNAQSVIPAEEQWTCPRCTLVNNALALQCAACLGMRSGTTERGPRELEMAHESNGWTCAVCGEHDIPRDFWRCRFCSSVKVRSA